MSYGMNHYFYSRDQQTMPGVVRVIVPGLPQPVYTNKNLAEQLKALVKSRKLEEARTMVKWLGGMEFQQPLE